MPELVEHCDIAIGNEEDADKVLGIKARRDRRHLGQAGRGQVPARLRAARKRFPNLKTIAITLRGSISASHNTWSAMLWSDGESVSGPPMTSPTSWTAWAAATRSWAA